MKMDRNYGMGYPYQPPMMPPVMPFNYETNSIEQRLNEIEKRLSFVEANMNGQKMTSSNMSNYQMI